MNLPPYVRQRAKESNSMGSSHNPYYIGMYYKISFAYLTIALV